MPADTFSNGLGFLIMQTGNDNNTWGVNCNSFDFQIFEDAISGQITVNTTGGTTDLSGTPPPAAARQERYSQIVITGALTSNATIKVCQISKNWWVLNNTTGNFDVLMQTSNAGAVPVTIPNGKLINVSCVSTTQLVRSDHAQVGEYASLGAIPATSNGISYGAGVLRADGSAVSRVGKVDLFRYFGTTYGAGDGSTTFNLPTVTDTGRYLRSYVPGTTTVGTQQANQNAAHTHAITDPGHSHAVTDPGHIHAITDPGHTHTQQGTFTSGNESATHTHTDVPSSLNSSSNAGLGASAGGVNTFNQATTGTESANHTHNTTLSGQTASNTTGISINSHTTGLTTNSATTGITINSQGGSEARPETMIAYMGVHY